MSSTSKQISKRPRGFALLIVLAVIAMASALLATQLSAVRGQEAQQIRSAEDGKARDIAEHCLELADAYAENWANHNADFDGLLDPDGVIEAADDDFLPPSSLLTSSSSGVAVIPLGASGSKFRWRGFHIHVAATGGTSGTCFIRYDDNNDDTSSTLSAANTSNTGGVIEGADIDVAERDRDRSIYTTAIGVVPQRSTLQASYDDAHARATVERLRSMPRAVASGSAIHAGGTVDLDGDVCGSVASVVADQVRGGLCVCGALDAELVAGSQGGCACGTESCAATTGSDITAGDRAAPEVTVPPYTTLLQNEAFGAPGQTEGTNIAASSYAAAVVFVRSASSPNTPATYMPAGTTDVFVWDKHDDNTATTLGTGPAKDCRDTTSLDPLPPPCKWAPTAGSLSSRLTCSASETPCWKLVARLGDASVADVDIRATASVVDHSNATSSAFAPKAGDLPNVKLSGSNSGEWRDFAAGTSLADGTINVVTVAGTNVTVANNSNTAKVPSMYVVIDSTAASTTTVSGLVRVGAKISVSTNNVVDVASSTQCCVSCNCPEACSSTTTMTAADNAAGYAIRTDQACADSGAVGIIGNVMCAQLDMSNTNNNCVVGGMIGTSTAGTIACNLPGTSSAIDAVCNANAGFCVKNNLDLVGDLKSAGNVCMKNNLDMNGGTIQSQGTVAWKNNPRAVGRIIAVKNVLGKSNATLVFDGTSGSSSDNQGIASAMWMDATW